MTEPIEAEIVPNTQSLMVRAATELPTVQDLEQQFALAVRQRELLSEYIKKQLVPGKHFYQRGMQKPSLAKEGAEIILLPHNLAPDYEQTGGPEAPPADGKPYQITVKCILRRKGDPESFVGSGIGSAGSEKQLKDGSYQPRQNDKYLCHNATLKMAQKSAMIAATINSTAASEFFTQDMDEPASTESKQRQPPTAPRQAETKPKPAETVKLKPPTAATRMWMIDQLTKADLHDIAVEYFRKVDSPSVLMPNEGLSEVPLRFVPNCHQEMSMLITKVKEFANGDRAGHPFPPHDDADDDHPPKPAAESLPKGIPKNPEWWREIIVPVPPKGSKRADYMVNPDTLGTLFDKRHGNDEEAQSARQRLWGFVNHYEAKPWVGKDGKQRPPSDTDVKFREALDALADWFEKNHRGEKL